MSKRNLAVLCVAVAAALPCATAQQQARIKIDTERVVGEVNPRLFGNFTEHLGRCIYGGIYEEGNPLSDADGFRKDVMEATRNLGVTVLRWPGGNFASGYRWMDGIGPKDRRTARRDHAWGALDSNRFGTDEFLKYCRRVGAEPYVCINAGLGSIDDARDWVEYCNEPGKTKLADLRRANGHEQPYGVKIWGLGNEIDGPWQLGHRNAQDYAKFALEAAKAMRRADESIQLIASGSSNFRPDADWIGWNRTVLETLKNEIDFISLHTYIGNRENNLEQFLGVGADIDRRIEIVNGLIQAAQETQTTRRPIYIAFDEWNVWYRTFGNTEFETGRMGLEEHYNFEDSLAIGVFLNSFFRHANTVRLANLAQLVNVIAPMFSNHEGLYLQTTYWPLLEYGKQRGNASLDLVATSPTYDYHGQKIGYLDVSSTYNVSAHKLFVNVLNRSASRDLEARIDNVTGLLGSEAGVWQMDNADLKAVNDFGNDKKVRPVTRRDKLAVERNGFTYKFPKHSLTILELAVN